MTRLSTLVRRLWLAAGPLLIRARGMQHLDVGLALLAFAALLLTGTLYAERTATENDLARLRATPSGQAQAPADAAALASYGVSWSQVLQAIVASMPGDVSVQDVGFSTGPSGVQAAVKGQATEYEQVVGFAENLRSSPLFSKVAIQSMNQAPAGAPASTASPTPTASSTAGMPPPTRPSNTPVTQPIPPFATPTTGANIPSFPFPMPPGGTAPQPTATVGGLPPFPTPGGSFPPTATPTPAPPLFQPPSWVLPYGSPVVVIPTITSPIFGTATPTTATTPPTGIGLPTVPIGLPPSTATPTASATPASNYDFRVLGKTQSCDNSVPADYSGDLITGRVVDVDDTGLRDIRVRVTSIHTDSPWSAETTTDDQGAYRFYLTKANFKVEVMSGTSEAATELWTRSTGEQGVCTWQVVFQKNNPRTPTPGVTWTPTITPTPSTSPTVTPTPPPGTAVAGNQTTASSNAGDARLAVDGDTATIWNAGAGPYQYWQETFANPISVAGFTLVVAQTPNGNTTHIVRFYGITGVELFGSAVTLTGFTFDGQQLSQTLATPLDGVATVRVETTSGPSHVAWREVRVIAGPAPTATPSPTATPRTWSNAQWIGVGEVQSRVFSYAGDVDWAAFHTSYISSTERISTTVRAVSGTDVDADLWVYEGDPSRAIGYSGSDCPPRDPWLVLPLKYDTTYYVRIRNGGAGAGTYSLTVRTGALTCDQTDSTQAAASPAASPAPAPPTATPTPTTPSAHRPGLAAPLGAASGLPVSEAVAAPKPVLFAIVLEVKTRAGP